jgi:hyperosmotically inducible protein
MRNIVIVFSVLLVFVAAGCTPAIIAGGATGGYKVATDERSVGNMWDDSTITSKIKTALVKDPNVSARKIDVDTVEGHVVLTGVVPTLSESQKATEIARSVVGVQKVTNNLQLGSRSFGQAVDDKVIGTRIKSKLIGEPEIRSLNIDVDVNLGVVTLTGIVENSKQRERVIAIARTTAGTQKIIDNLSIK